MLSYKDIGFIETIEERKLLGSNLEEATKLALNKLSKSYIDKTKASNFNTRHIPDFVLSSSVIECKNYRCIGEFSSYKVTRNKALREIITRFYNYSKLHKILIIADPLFTKKTLRLLKLQSIRIITLGYGVTKSTFNKAIQDITNKLQDIFAYLDNIINTKNNRAFGLSFNIKHIIRIKNRIRKSNFKALKCRIQRILAKSARRIKHSLFLKLTPKLVECKALAVLTRIVLAYSRKRYSFIHIFLQARASNILRNKLTITSNIVRINRM